MDWETGRLFDPEDAGFAVEALFVWTGVFDPVDGAFVPEGATVLPNPEARAHATAEEEEEEHAIESKDTATSAIIPDELSPPLIS
jgi:hypothetical protein